MFRTAGSWGVTPIEVSLGPERRRSVPGASGFAVRVDDDLRKTVLFFGLEDATPGKGGINCVGTGFLLNFDGLGYLVTAKHLAHALGDAPFLVRLNKKDGTSENLGVDLADGGMRWYEHPEPEVDIAVMPLHVASPDSIYDALYLPERMIAQDGLINHPTIKTIGVGDLTYTVGLFRLMSGEKRNLPIVHFGTIAMMPKDEKIPVQDWRAPFEKKRLFVEGYLVETHAIQGLSGSPVFVRPTVSLPRLPGNFIPDPRSSAGAMATALAPRGDLMLLGLWQSSWDAPPDEVMAAQTGQGVRVPVGLGIVVPAQKIIDTFMQEELVTMRNEVKARQAQRQHTEAATPDSAIPVARAAEAVAKPEPTGDENPQHREDFTRLVSAASKPKPRDGRT
jgi:hypothetical protein